MAQAITGDSVVVKFEKAKFALEDSLRRVNDIVPEAIGCEVIIYVLLATYSPFFVGRWLPILSVPHCICLKFNTLDCNRISGTACYKVVCFARIYMLTQ